MFGCVSISSALERGSSLQTTQQCRARGGEDRQPASRPRPDEPERNRVAVRELTTSLQQVKGEEIRTLAEGPGPHPAFRSDRRDERHVVQPIAVPHAAWRRRDAFVIQDRKSVV